jgi:hypothetical protein
MNPLDEIAKDISGVAALTDWLGENGSPVDPMVASFRAQRCLIANGGQPCPKNVEPNWWDRVKHKIADWIRAELELKHRMALHVESEDKLHMCQVCGCCLQLKVWTPIKHIRDHTPAEKISQFPEYCWIKRELSQ